MSAEPVIDLERLMVTYGDSTAARDVSFNVLTGELYELVGTNGAGKPSPVTAEGCGRSG